jgi:hypothetical protein
MDDPARTKSTASSVVDVEEAESAPDMIDTPDEVDRHQEPLRRALAHFQDHLSGSFETYDRLAKRQQRGHRLIVTVFCVAGSLAVIFSILNVTRLLPLKNNPEVAEYLAIGLFWGESIAVIVALFAALLGIIRAFQEKWLVTRHKAESLRFLKFGALIDPALLSGNEADFNKWKSDLSDEQNRIRTVDHDSLRERVEEARIPLPFAEPLARPVADQTIQDLVEYSERKRLGPQARYFFNRAQRNTRWDWYTRLLPPALFFASVFFAVLHLIHEVIEFIEHGSAEYFESWTRPANKWSILFIVLAGSLPVLGAALRGLRSAYEFSRNTLRLRANHFALELLRDRLRHEKEPELILNTLWWSELMLEAEHREWLRLMIEAEWIG